MAVYTRQGGIPAVSFDVTIEICDTGFVVRRYWPVASAVVATRRDAIKVARRFLKDAVKHAEANKV